MRRGRRLCTVVGLLDFGNFKADAYKLYEMPVFAIIGVLGGTTVPNLSPLVHSCATLPSCSVSQTEACRYRVRHALGLLRHATRTHMPHATPHAVSNCAVFKSNKTCYEYSYEVQ